MSTERRLGPLDVFVLSAWCGLAGGLLEVGTRVVWKILPSHRMYLMSRHFIWMAPLSNLLLFTGVGVLLALATKLWPCRGGMLFSRAVCFLAILPVLIVMSPRIYPGALAILAMGISVRLVPFLERRHAEVRRVLMRSFPLLLGIVVVTGTFVFGRDWLKERRELFRPLPPGDPPNVLLIVLDTVRADRLSLYGYHRPTSPALEALAKEGIRFDEARTTAPWTLPSHASMFTGRWPHELDASWRVPLGTKFATLAEYLGSRGYATAGFVANVEYCSSEFGLDRGFTHYEDYAFEPLTPLRLCLLGDLALKGVSRLGWMLNSSLGAISLLPHKESMVWPMLASDSKINARAINRKFLAWLSQRREPTRPFFAFLNYFDAHTVYMLPPGSPYRFGRPPKTDVDVEIIVDWNSIDKLRLPPSYVNLARDCYDSCIGYLDDHLGRLIDELKRRGVLDHTIVIVTSDHGEGLGEHNLFFHGESLYRPEIHVPLLIVLPGNSPPKVVSEPVSLRDLPATIVDLTGQATVAQFPGRSLARLWRDSRPADPYRPWEGVISELASPNPYDPNQGRSPAHRGALAALTEGDYVYIRNEGDGSEELFNRRDDPNEADNRAGFKAMQAVKERLRTHLDQMRAGHRVAAE
jgi:arylsulfatase A-like enzyme